MHNRRCYAAAAGAACLALATSAGAVTLDITVTNQMSANGGGLISPVWVGLHDGSFDTFTPGESASPAVKLIAEDGITGFESQAQIEALLAQRPDIDIGTIAQIRNDSMATTFANAASDARWAQAVAAGSARPPLSPQESVTVSIDLGPTHDSTTFLSYATMLFPSNDAFIADLEPIPLIDSEGDLLLQEFTVFGREIWDAGTEVNDERIAHLPANAAGTLVGVAENGVIHEFAGIGSTPPPEGDWILGTGAFNPAVLDFDREGYEFAHFSFSLRDTNMTTVSEPSGLAAVLMAGLALAAARRRRK